MCLLGSCRVPLLRWGGPLGILCPSCGLGDAMGRVVSGRPEAYKEERLSFQNDEHPSFIIYL
jgi:hypothetical protein